VQKSKPKVKVIEIDSDESSDSASGLDSDSDSDSDNSVVFLKSTTTTTTTSSSSSSSSTTTPRASSSSKRKRSLSKPDPISSIEVRLDPRDIPAAPGRHDADPHPAISTNDSDVSPAVSADGKIKERIMKILNVGLGSGSTEAEAQQAMRLAQRLMKKNNIKQVELMKERNGGEIKTDEGTLKGGLVTIKLLTRATQEELSILPRWLDSLMTPVANNFDVKVYKSRYKRHSNRKTRFTMTFYGIMSNCQLAAYAFKIAAEKIDVMTQLHVPLKPPPGVSKASHTRTGRLSYSIGVVDGLKASVQESKRREKERKEAKLARARKAIKNGEAYEESDDDDDDEGGAFGGFGDLDGFDDWEPRSAEPLPSDDESDEDSDTDEEGEGDEIPLSSLLNDIKVKAERKESKKRAKAVIARIEREKSSALVLVDHNKKIAEKVLVDRNITVKKGSVRPKIQFNKHSHQKGKEDSREIDLDQRALKNNPPPIKSEKPKKARVSIP